MMWVYSKHRGEHDFRFLMNLDQCSRINMTPLGEKWFIEVTLGSETIPIAQVGTKEEADAIFREIFEGMKQAKSAIDLEDSAKAPEEKQAQERPPETDKPIGS